MVPILGEPLGGGPERGGRKLVVDGRAEPGGRVPSGRRLEALLALALILAFEHVVEAVCVLRGEGWVTWRA